MVARIDISLEFAKARAGARRNRSTIEHLFTFKSLMQHYEKTENYVEFLLDVEKAYDQAWNFLHDLKWRY